MKAIMLMFDSLNRRMLPPYGCEWIKAPNFQRLAERTVCFDNSYVGSMPCMPARREIHTGRYNFLHRSWGPIEPFDDSMPEILKKNGVYSHLVSDHYHYWEAGGCTYHTKYSSWEISRGQEGDAWIGQVKDPVIPEGAKWRRDNLAKIAPEMWRQDWVNREYMKEQECHPQHKTFEMGIEFLKRNCKEDRWFIQIETFDPHEPFFSYKKYKDLYAHDYSGPHFDWLPYDAVSEPDDQVRHLRLEYAALLSMCDDYLGKVLDVMDELNLWKDTMLIVNTDHGILLGEHGWWGKSNMPLYNEIALTPLFIWDPRCGKHNERRQSFVQTIDLAPTILEYFGIEIPKDMQGKPLKETIASDKPARECGLLGYFGKHVNVTDGRYIYMRAPVREDNQPLFEYTHMPTHMRTPFHINELQDIQLGGPFSFTKGCRMMKINSKGNSYYKTYEYQTGNLLFDIKNDPAQENPIKDPQIEERMIQLMIKLMEENDTPAEQYERLGLSK